MKVSLFSKKADKPLEIIDTDENNDAENNSGVVQ
jgi:hypothetical protein